MNTQKYHFAIVVLLLGVGLLPVTTASQSTDRDLGIVRLRYVTIVVRTYDEAINCYTNAPGLEKPQEGAFAFAKRCSVVAAGVHPELRMIFETANPEHALGKGTN